MIKIKENYPEEKENKILKRMDVINRYKKVLNVSKNLENFFEEGYKEKTLVKIKNKFKIAEWLKYKEMPEEIKLENIKEEDIKEAYFNENTGAIISIVKGKNNDIIFEITSYPHYETEATNENVEIFLYKDEIKIDKEILKNELDKYVKNSEEIESIEINARELKNSKEYIVRDETLNQLLSIKVYRKLEESEKNNLIKFSTIRYNKKLFLNRKFKKMVEEQNENIINEFNYVIKINYISDVACVLARIIKGFLLQTQDIYEMKADDMYLGIGDGETQYVKIKKETQKRSHDITTYKYYENPDFYYLCDELNHIENINCCDKRDYLYQPFCNMLKYMEVSIPLIIFLVILLIISVFITSFINGSGMAEIGIILKYSLLIVLTIWLIGLLICTIRKKIETIKMVLQYNEKKIYKGSSFKGYIWFEIIREKILEKKYNKEKQKILKKYNVPENIDYNAIEGVFFSESEVIYNFLRFYCILDLDLMDEGIDPLHKEYYMKYVKTIR